MRYLLFTLLFLCSPVWANDLLIYYTSSESSQYSNLKSHFEDLGFTVTGSTSTTVSSTDVSGKEMVIDITGNSNCGSTCRSVYDSYVSGGGKLIIAAENGATNRIGNIESLIENKMQVGSYTAVVNGNDAYQSFRSGNYAGSTSNLDTLPGVDGYMYSITGGEVVASNSSINTTYQTWHKWDYGTNGGAVYVTFGYGQFLSTNSYSGNMEGLLTAIATEEGLYSSSPTTSTTTGTSGGITSAQSSNKSSARTRSNSHSDNSVYIDQVGDNNTVTIEQDGTATNTIRGIYSSGDDAGLIQGDSNTIEIRQGADTSTSSNLIEFKIIGSTNDILLYQDRLNNGYEDSQAGGGHNIILDVYGSSNDIDLIQRNNYDTYGGHYIDLEVDGSSNTINMKQISDYSKDIFGKVTGNSNSVDVYQEGDANKYLDFDLTGNGHTIDVDQLGSGAHDAEITLIYGSAPSTVNLLQQGSTDQSYSIEQTCYTTGGCSTTVTQGQ